MALVPQAGREYDILFAKADPAPHQIKKSCKHNARIYRDSETEQAEDSGDLTNLRMLFGERNPDETAPVADRELFRSIYQVMSRLSADNGRAST